MNHKQVNEYLNEMPAETPIAYGLHPNAEIGFKLREAEAFCASLILMQPQGSGGEGGLSTEEKVCALASVRTAGRNRHGDSTSESSTRPRPSARSLSSIRISCQGDS